MKLSIKYSFVLFVICSCSVFSRGTSPNGYEKELKQSMDFLIQGKSLNAEQIEKAIPQTEVDFSTFYSYTERDEKSNVAFYKLNSLILEHAMIKKEPFSSLSCYFLNLLMVNMLKVILRM